MSIVSNHFPEVITEMNADPVVVRVQKPRKKQARSIRLAVTLNADGRNGLVVITEGKKVDAYHLDRIEADWGSAFQMEKIGGEEGPYAVNLDGNRSVCECKGNLQHGHCRHVEGLTVLVQRGKITLTAHTQQNAA